MKSLSDIIAQHQLVAVTGILLVMYFFAVVPKSVELFKFLIKTKGTFKKTMYSMFFIVSVVADLAIMTLAIHGLVYFLKA
jgi:hypothetical protein